MTAAQAQVVDHELDRIEGWRLEELERAGYTYAQAAELAPRLDVDLHLAVDLLERGCDSTLALKILL